MREKTDSRAIANLTKVMTKEFIFLCQSYKNQYVIFKNEHAEFATKLILLLKFFDEQDSTDPLLKLLVLGALIKETKDYLEQMGSVKFKKQLDVFINKYNLDNASVYKNDGYDLVFAEGSFKSVHDEINNMDVGAFTQNLTTLSENYGKISMLKNGDKEEDSWLIELRLDHSMKQKLINWIKGNQTRRNSSHDKSDLIKSLESDIANQIDLLNQHYKTNWSITSYYSKSIEQWLTTCSKQNIEVNSEDSKTKFVTMHHNLLRAEKSVFFLGWFRNTQIDYSQSLEYYVKHAQDNNNRTRRAFVELEWMTEDGELTELGSKATNSEKPANNLDNFI